MRGIPYIRIGATLLAGLVIGIGLGLIILYGLNDTKLPVSEEILSNSLLFGNNLAVGKKAPDIELSTLKGDTVRLSDLTGVPVLIAVRACPVLLVAPLMTIASISRT